MFLGCGDCQVNSVDAEAANNSTHNIHTEGASADNSAVLLQYKHKKDSDSASINSARDKEVMVTSADAAPTGETALQRYKRLRYRNAVIMGSPCGQSRQPGSPDESAGVPFERTGEYIIPMMCMAA